MANDLSKPQSRTYNWVGLLRNVTMCAHPLRLAVPLALGLAAGCAQADIYTWVDATGMVNMSNVAPPDGVHVTKVTHDSPPPIVPLRDVAADAAQQAQVQALAARVMQLEYEAEFSRRQVASVATYVPPAAPMYIPQYVDNDQQPSNNGCDPSWNQCGGWWGPGFVPTTVFVVNSPRFRRSPPFHGGGKFGMQMPQTPVRAPGGFKHR
ncbi:MAG: DUF4124 domain-containing protein [Casimicrobiaceae bacterium]